MGIGVEFPTPFVAGCTAEDGGFTPYFGANGLEGNDWTSTGGAGVRISVSDDDSEWWLVNSSGSVFSFTGIVGEGGHWGLEPGAAIDVSAGSGTDSSANVPPWMVDTGNKLNQWSGSGWSAVSGGPPATKVSVGFDGTVWLIDTSGSIWSYE